MGKHKRRIILLASILIVLTIISKTSVNTPRDYVSINQHQIIVEIVSDEVSRSRGLSDREMLGNDQGMLFLFSQKGRYNFWMNRMKFNLDFIFIDGNKIVDLLSNVPAPIGDEWPVTVQAKSDFDKVLEINAGKIKELNINIGDNAIYRSGAKELDNGL